MYAEQFIKDEVIVKSERTIKSIQCNDYSIDIVTVQFPFKYERSIPSKFLINGYHGDNNIIDRNAFIMPKKERLPLPHEIKSTKSFILKNRTYLPYKAVCNAEKFVVFYHSGGNCKKCETFIQFDVVNNMAVNPTHINYKEVKKNYSNR